MRNSFLFLLLVALTSETMGACVCVIAPIHIYASGAAICFAKRYETGDCAPGRCQYPTNVWDHRLKGNWEHYPEVCPRCRQFLLSSAAKAGVSDGNCGAKGEPGKDGGEPDVFEIEGLPVKEDFDPVKERRIPQGSVARLIGFYTLGTANKVATNVDSDVCLKLENDIEVKIFSVRIPKLDDEPLIAYQVEQQVDSAKRIDGGSITNVRFEPNIGDRVLSLRVSHPDDDQFRGKNVYVLRGQK